MHGLLNGGSEKNWEDETMAEEPQRYCGNCGHELSPEDQFCQNCGTPVHRAARVPTPEADLPVPPPSQAGGGGAAPPEQQPAQERPAQQAGWGRRHPILTGCLGIIGLFILVIIIAAALSGGGGETAGSGGGGGDAVEKLKQKDQKQQAAQQEKPQAEKPKPKPEYSVGQTATVGNVEWKVSDAFLTNQLKSNFGTQKRGRFVVVDFTFTNNRGEEVTLDPELHMILKDSRGREFGTDSDAWEFVPTDLNIFLTPVNPGVSTNGRVVYEVPADAKDFTLTLDDVELMEDKSAVFDLSNISLRAYDASSASATATATATASRGRNLSKRKKALFTQRRGNGVLRSAACSLLLGRTKYRIKV
jgi:hypothetical protein